MLKYFLISAIQSIFIRKFSLILNNKKFYYFRPNF